eukprot:CAMPEP_0181047508 /NCGR_PEP_ID=MMETSP1070-20121207/14921_1 /TAXON_ID=265543 /ORGANISM="Minutocellus polymorphus, Strain NH13" /LENGTH=202 /DNA_ID=CAMNT_0023126193 /DNA_START=100 /DNA_END=708 /DNA_ORIENTATION=+
MKFFSAVIVLSTFAAKAIADTDVIEPVEEDQLIEKPSKVDDVAEERSKGGEGDIKSSIGFMSISTTCNDATFWVKNLVDADIRRKLYGTNFEDVDIVGYTGNNCAPTTAKGFSAFTCHPDMNVANHFTLNDVSAASRIDLYWEAASSSDCDISVRISCPPADETDMPNYYIDTTFTRNTVATILDPCKDYSRRSLRSLRKNA